MTSWTRRPVSDLIDGLAAGVSVRSTTAAVSGPAVLKTSAVDAGRFDPRESKTILPADVPRARCTVAAGSMIVSRMNTPAMVGDVGFVAEARDDLYLPDRLWLARAKRSSGTDMRWLTYYFASETGARELRSLATGTSGSMKNIPKDRVLRLEINVPPQSEQRAIADALGDADALISALEHLVVKKQAIKQGAIQQLLTGKTRLPMYGGAWDLRSVNEMGDVLAGKALNPNGRGDLRPYLRTKNVLDGRINLADVLWMPMTDSEFLKFRVESGDVLLNEGQSLDLVGRCSLYRGEFDRPCAMQNQLLRFRSYEKTSPEFAAHLFRYCQAAGVFAAIATKTTSVAHLGSSRLSKLRLLWPTKRSEQVAIAKVLSDMDTQIAAYEARLDKARSIKQGMMQQLLTGRTSLPVREGPHE